MQMSKVTNISAEKLSTHVFDYVNQIFNNCPGKVRV